MLRRQAWLVPVLIIFLALLLRLPNLGNSFYGDEKFSLLSDSNHFLTQTFDRARPLFFSLLFLWRTIGFDGEVGLRLLPLIFGLLAVPLAWIAALRVGGRKFAIGFSLLLATSPLHIEFSQELRMYSLLALWSFAQLACYMYYRENKSLSALFFGALVGAAGMYTHPFYAFHLLGFVLLVFLDRGTVRPLPYLLSFVGIALLYAPNIGNLLWILTALDEEFILHLPSVLPKLVAAFSVGFNLFNVPELSQGRGIGWQVIWQNWYYILPCLFVFGLLVAGAVKRMFQSEGRFAFISVISLLIFPALFSYGLEIATYKNVIMAKFVIFLLPGTLLLFIYGFQGLRWRPLQTSVGILYSVLIGLSLFHFYTDPVHYGRRHNWRAAAKYLKEHLSNETPLVLLDSWGYQLLDYYCIEIHPYWRLVKSPRGKISVPDYIPYLQKRLSKAREVYYLREDDSQNALDPNDTVLKSLRTFGTDELHTQYNRRFQLYGWKLPERSP